MGSGERTGEQNAFRELMVPTLENLLAATYGRARRAGITPEAWRGFIDFLEALHEHNSTHYEHSLRVGIYAFDLALHEGQRDLKYPLYAGCGHDLGKCDIANEIIEHPNFGPEQMEAMKAHTFQGFERLKDHYLWTAFVAGLHHKYQPNGYGIDLRECVPEGLSDEAVAKIEWMAGFISLCDFFDALTTRSGPMAGDVEGTMRKRFPDQSDRVDWLLANRL